MDDPYTILGVSKSASLEEIKTKYKNLARLHHPDKLGHLPNAEKEEHEQYFKKVTVAYRFLIDHHSESGGCDSAYDPKSWYETWSKLDERMQSEDIMATMSSFFKSSIFDAAKKFSEMKKAAAASEGATAPEGNEVHVVKLQVTLEEIHMHKRRKVRLFLKHEPVPVCVSVDCGKYPVCDLICNTDDDRELHIQVELDPIPHDIYCNMEFDNIFDLFCETTIDLHEYFVGTTRNLQYVDGSILCVNIPPMPDLYRYVVIERHGLQSRGDLHVNVRLEPKNKFCVENMPSEIKNIFLDTISGAANHKTI